MINGISANNLHEVRCGISTKTSCRCCRCYQFCTGVIRIKACFARRHRFSILAHGGAHCPQEKRLQFLLGGNPHERIRSQALLERKYRGKRFDLQHVGQRFARFGVKLGDAHTAAGLLSEERKGKIGEHARLAIRWNCCTDRNDDTVPVFFHV